MISVSLDWLAQQVQGELRGEDCVIQGICTDTRSLKQGDVFLALVGPNFDGHKFVQQAQNLGACAVVVSQDVETDLPTIIVNDTHKALGLAGAAIKRKVAPKTIAITGSSGKTTTREMCAAILAQKGSVLSTNGNFNNDIGVPLTLLRLESHHEFAVIELGANHLGEIAYTTNLVKPDVATVLNAGNAHLEGFGSLLGVARAKSEIFKGLDEQSGIAILNHDSQFYEFWKGKCKYLTQQTFAADAGAEFYAQDVVLGLDGCAQFVLVTPDGRTDVNLVVPGIHNVQNAISAAALTMQVGASLEDIKFGLEQMAHVKGRLQVKQLTNQVRLIDDSYNANVSSVKAAIDLLSSFSGRQVLVLGDMGELGEKARYYHQEVGEYAQELGVKNLYSLGVLSQSASDVFAEQGRHFSDVESMIDYISEQMKFEQQDLTLLVKGSRSARMERVVVALEGSPVGKLERVRERIAC